MVDNWLVSPTLGLELNDDDKCEHINEVVEFSLEDIFADLNNFLDLTIDPRTGNKGLPLFYSLVLFLFNTDPQGVIELVELIDKVVNGSSVVNDVGFLLQKLVVVVLESQDPVRLVIWSGYYLNELALVMEQRLLKLVPNFLQFRQLLVYGLPVGLFQGKLFPEQKTSRLLG